MFSSLKLRGVLIQTAIALPFALFTPLSFVRLLSWAIDINNSGGGLFYFPTTPLEVLYVLGLLVSAFPFFATVFLLIVPIGFVNQAIGLQFTGVLPLFGLAPTFDASFTIAIGIGISVQIITWSLPIRSLFKRIEKSYSLEMWKNH